MSENYYNSIKDEDIRTVADNLQQTKGWDKDLAAVAATAGPAAVAVIERALGQRQEERKKEIDAENQGRIDRLTAQYHAAKESGDAQRAISIKNALHREGVFV